LRARGGGTNRSEGQRFRYAFVDGGAACPYYEYFVFVSGKRQRLGREGLGAGNAQIRLSLELSIATEDEFA
jgi:hypothetical protein